MLFRGDPSEKDWQLFQKNKGLAGRIYGKISSGIHGNSAKGCIGIGKILDFGRKNQPEL